LINPPLASTAVGVVAPQQAGMASGINSTFRQVGIATGIALLGTLFASRVSASVLSHTAASPHLSGKGSALATAVQSGTVGSALQHLPKALQAQAALIARTAFTDGLNRILLISAIIAAVSGVIAFSTIRKKDLAHQGGQ
jgi:hypothetical protein